jgi:hypothetical protein
MQIPTDCVRLFMIGILLPRIKSHRLGYFNIDNDNWNEDNNPQNRNDNGGLVLEYSKPRSAFQTGQNPVTECPLRLRLLERANFESRLSPVSLVGWPGVQTKNHPARSGRATEGQRPVFWFCGLLVRFDVKSG